MQKSPPRRTSFFPGRRPGKRLKLSTPGNTPRSSAPAHSPVLEKVLTLQRPQLVIYLAGADPYAEDQLGGLALTVEGLSERDRMVLTHCARAGTPVAVVLAGGYARMVEDTVTIHRHTVEVAREIWAGGS